jgi:hypothetical protein
MAIAYGTQTSLVLFTESATAYGTPGANGIRQPFVSESLKVSQQSLDSNTISASRERLKPALSNINVSGSIATELATEASMFLLYAAVGSYTGSGTAAPYTHTFKTGATNHPSFTAEMNYGDNAPASAKYSKFVGCKINNMTLQVPNSGFVTINYDVIGQSADISGAALDSAPYVISGFTPFSSYHCTILIDNVQSSNVESLSVSLNNQLDESMYTIKADGKRSDLPAGFQTITGQFSAIFDNATDNASTGSLLNKAETNTKVNIKIIFAKTRNSVTSDGSAVGKEKVTIEIPNALLERTSPEVSGPGGIKVAFSFKAYIASSTENAMTITVLSPTAIFATDSSGVITIPAS